MIGSRLCPVVDAVVPYVGEAWFIANAFMREAEKANNLFNEFIKPYVGKPIWVFDLDSDQWVGALNYPPRRSEVKALLAAT